MVFNFDDASFYGIYGSSMNDKQAYDVVNEIVSCWIEQEKPLICGKQLITRSIFFERFRRTEVDYCNAGNRIEFMEADF